MVLLGGNERATFEVLRTLRDGGAAVHCVVNSWENGRIVAHAEAIGASWSTGYYWYRPRRGGRNPIPWIQFGWDVVRTSAGLRRDARRHRATHVLVPEWETAIRNAPALWLLRRKGVRVVLRAANHPDGGRLHAWLWSRLLPPVVTRFVANSEFSAGRMRAIGVPPDRIATIRNTVARRDVATAADEEAVSLVGAKRTILCVGQIAPFKGTHLVVDAARALAAEGEDFEVAIVGAMPEWPPALERYAAGLRARVAESGLAGRVRFLGERHNVLAIMRAAYVLAAPILQEETFGNVALEAKSVGLPVVAFASGGLTELVEHGVTGYLSAEASLPGLLEGLRYFLADRARRDKASAASLAALADPGSPYAREVFAAQWWALLGEPR
jgi:glycosyltransferase involved in cell wall biosynthesis